VEDDATVFELLPARPCIVLVFTRVTFVIAGRYGRSLSRLQISPPSDLDPVGHGAVALLETGRVAGVHPKHPRLG
jgi:hypothetical protein